MLARALVFSIFLSFSLLQASRSRSYRNVEEEWTKFKETFGKKYASEEEDAKHLAIFIRRWQVIEEHNKHYQEHWYGFELGYNYRTDLPDEAYGFQPLPATPTMRGRRMNLKNLTRTPDSVDWRKQGFVSPVKDQGTNCSWSFAFAAAAAIEGRIRFNSQAPNVSVQELIDCDPMYSCKYSGDPSSLLFFMESTGTKGLENAATYPYTGAKHSCHFNPKNEILSLIGTHDFEALSEEELKFVVYHMGVTAVGVDANHDDFRSYKQGIYSPWSCNSSSLNHYMVIVGYGNDEEWGDYWILKNSWGTGWGEGGYMRMVRNAGDPCGLTQKPVIPIVVKPPVSPLKKPTATF